MKKLICLLWVIMGFYSPSVYAFDVEFQGIYYEIQDSIACVVPGFQPYQGDIILPDSVEYNHRSYPVTIVEAEAFRNCTSLLSIDLGNVRKIRGAAFAGCKRLQFIDLQKVDVIETKKEMYDSYQEAPFIGAFADCEQLKQVVLGPALSILPINAFKACTNLQTINLSKIKHIESGAFFHCDKLDVTTLDLKNVKIIEGTTRGPAHRENNLGAFAYCTSSEGFLLFGDSIGLIQADAFMNCSVRHVQFGKSLPAIFGFNEEGLRVAFGTSVESIDFGEIKHISSEYCRNLDRLTSIEFSHVKSIGSFAFRGCSALKNVDLDSVSTLGDGAFQDCSALQSVKANMVTLLPTAVFKNCSSLMSLDGRSVVAIEDESFKGCESLTLVSMDALTTIGNEAFRGCSALSNVKMDALITIGDKAFKDCRALLEVRLDSVRHLGLQAFNGCENLTSLGSLNMDSISDCAFEGLVNLSTLDCNKVVTLGKASFRGCSNIEKIVIRNIEEMGDSAFIHCGLIHSIKIYKTNPPTIHTRTFDDIDYMRAKVEVPIGTLSAYQQSKGWKRFSLIEESGEVSFNHLICSLTSHYGGSISYNEKRIENTTFQTYIKKGEPIVLYIQPWRGYKIKSVLVNGEEWIHQVKNNQLELMIDADTYLEFFFVPLTLLLDDNSLYQNREDTLYSEVTYIRDFLDTEWQAFYVPFGLNYEDWQANFEIAHVNQVNVYDDNYDGKIDKVVLEIGILSERTVTKANTPYFIHAKSIGHKSLQLRDLVVEKAKENQLDSMVGTTHITFQGTYMGIPGEEMRKNGYFTMCDGGLKQYEAYLPLSGFRWYVSVKDDSGHYFLPKEIWLKVKDAAGNVTGVEQQKLFREGEQQCWPADIYNMQGKMVRKSAMSTSGLDKGLYMVNGKKIYKN